MLYPLSLFHSSRSPFGLFAFTPGHDVWLHSISFSSPASFLLIRRSGDSTFGTLFFPPTRAVFLRVTLVRSPPMFPSPFSLCRAVACLFFAVFMELFTAGFESVSSASAFFPLVVLDERDFPFFIGHYLRWTLSSDDPPPSSFRVL